MEILPHVTKHVNPNTTRSHGYFTFKIKHKVLALTYYSM